MSARSIRWVIVGVVVLSIIIAGVVTTMAFASNSNKVTIQKVQSGMVSSDPLTGSLADHWTFGGDSMSNPSASYSHDVSSSGLSLGVRSSENGTWTGYYAAESTGPSARIFHAVISLPYKTIPSGSFNTGLYVQTTNNEVNYISCGAGVDPQGYYWQVVLGRGNVFAASSYQVLYFKWLNNQPLTQDCTIVTNGANLLMVYLGSNLVYSSSKMNLQTSQPFNVYLAVESTANTQTLYSSFRNYYATTNSSLVVSNAPKNGMVKLMDASNHTLLSAQANSNGNAVLPMSFQNAPLTGYLRVYDSSGKLVVSTSQSSTFWGGDVYSIKG